MKRPAPDPLNVRDSLLEAGYSPDEVDLMLHADLYALALRELRPLCAACDEPATRAFRRYAWELTPDSVMWLCDRTDDYHGGTACPWAIPSRAVMNDALRALVVAEGGPQAPVPCCANSRSRMFDAATNTLHPLGHSPECEEQPASGWVPAPE